MGDGSFRNLLDGHADQSADGVDDSVFGFEDVTVGDDFGGFMDDADGGHESRNLRCRPLWPAEAEGKGNQCVSGEMGCPVHGAGKGLASGGDAADGEQAKGEQHGCCAGEHGGGEKGCRVQSGLSINPEPDEPEPKK